ncbi:MAG TPA: hypothetical protein VFY23_06325 [Candidatus Limnocylindrales bacterium]|nr:hypothetical protein [Candidatus Limnocylindrales bacterium]
MGIVTALIAAALWLAGWTLACVILDIPLPIAVVGLVAGLAAAFFVGVKLGGSRLRSDPVSRLEERERARRRFEASVEAVAAGERRRRLQEADRAAEARAAARVRELVERARVAVPDSRAAGSTPDADPTVAGEGASGPREEVTPESPADPTRTRSGSRPR